MANDPRPVLDGINLVVRDMPASVEFYRRLGLDLRDAPPPWDRHHRNAGDPDGIDFDLDSTGFAAKWSEGGRADTTGVVFSFKVASRDEVDRLYAELTAAGYAGQQPPYDAFWGARYAIVEDPDGNGVGLMSPMDDAHRSAPPDP